MPEQSAKQDPVSLILSDFFVMPVAGGVVFVHGKESPSDTDFEKTFAVFESVLATHQNMGILVFTDGGAPTRKQRAELTRRFATQLRTTRVAIVSDAVAMRFVTAALSLFTPTVGTFDSQSLASAIEFAGLSSLGSHEWRANMKALTVDARVSCKALERATS